MIEFHHDSSKSRMNIALNVASILVCFLVYYHHLDPSPSRGAQSAGSGLGGESVREEPEVPGAEEA